LLQQTEPDGTASSNYLDAAGQVTLAVDAMGLPTQYRYVYGAYNAQVGGGDGDLVQVTQADGSSTQYQYDPTFHELTQTSQPVGAILEVSSNSYDPLTGDLLSSTDAAGATTTNTYYQSNGESNGLVATVTTPGPQGPVTSSDVYDSARRLIVSYDNLGVPTYTSYDANGNLAGTTNALGQTTQTVYNAANELVQTIDANGATTEDTYAADGQQTSDTNARGFTETTSYDQRGWVTATTDDAGVTTATDQYDAAGNVIQSTDANGNATTFQYDVDNRQTGQTDALGDSSSTVYNADGEVTETSDAAQRDTFYTYNLVGEQVSETCPSGGPRS
jgi:YD repeat-containing protein